MQSVGEPGDPVVHNPAQPTRYHYYPHNQHVYLLPECAIQQVCNAVYVRLNFTQPLCACPLGHRDPCSASLRTDDLHTTELVTDPRGTALTLVKTCEPVSEMRECRAPRDWSLLALQNVRTGKSHYLVICRCPSDNSLGKGTNEPRPTHIRERTWNTRLRNDVRAANSDQIQIVTTFEDDESGATFIGSTAAFSMASSSSIRQFAGMDCESRLIERWAST
ncbi:hypothetical protein B566_EDAN009920 [Ephemera danica]|nr:hypothetical protein B566_EDAN009920 [Ephemera danica]